LAIDRFPNNSFDIVWRPYQLNPGMPLQGMDRKDYLNNKFSSMDQALNIYRKIDKIGKKIGIFFQFEKITRTPNSFASHQLLALAHKISKQNQIIESLFYAFFVEGRDIGQIRELINIAEQHNIGSKEILNYLQSSNDKNNILKEETQAKKMGITGVPCFIINKEYVLFGAQEKEKFINIFENLIK